MQIKIEALDPNIGQTTKNTPKRGVKHDGQWLTVTHENRQLLAGLTSGQEIEVSDPKQYGKTWFASLRKVVEPPGPALPSPPAQESPKFPGTGMGIAFTPPSKPNGGAIAWADYILAMKAAHSAACDLEPDDQGEHICERSQARAALVNTAMIALTSGRVELPKIEDGVPF